MASPSFLADALPPKKKRSRKRERVFLTELRHSFEGHGAFFLKIADMPHFAGAKMRFDLEKPFDAVLCYQGLPIAIEAKTLKKYMAFGSQIRPSQIKGLNRFVAAGGRGFIFVNVRSAKPRMNRLLIFDWSTHGPSFSEGLTLKKAEMERWPFAVGKLGRFDLGTWLKVQMTKQTRSRPWHSAKRA